MSADVYNIICVHLSSSAVKNHKSSILAIDIMKYSRISETEKLANSWETRLYLEQLVTPSVPSEMSGSDVINGLSQHPKSLPPRYFYDDRGSKLFELICELPEYYLTRTETTILQECASQIAHLTGPAEIVELGSGSSTKTRILLDAYSQLGYPLRYLPIDISETILESSAYQLLTDYPSLEIHGIVSTYDLALAKLTPSPLPTRMICFLGSTLGNLNPEECDVFFSQIVGAMRLGEYFLLGVDLHKSKDILEPAYNDSQGVTAAFNLNMLQHLNRLFEGNFDLTQFQHWAFYNEEFHQIEMHLQSRRSQTVELRGLNLTVEFEEGETIRSEISRKFDLKIIQEELSRRGLVPLQVWTDKNHRFGLMLSQLQSKLG
ncbi:L-histidine N(alpha)-methyltransferase [Kamptonema animale CS-326]|jgi:L-histidine N-alpha-methyltransferase|uniref:L-histidine N(alpha)-methyltransferase n=1 Tax=Kamptonema animale TaxID=92934 RepID=UPI00232B88DB|nr:L-histidine N(alpha)-methyltransferase [Kamptonema animale]MDB9509988.1 L-histidine N(alpha)-methyltransferase [Kamptonema animale CS-326]